MVGNPFVPQNLVGRQTELRQVSQILAADGDLVLAGVPGIGRRTLVRWAARECGARVIDIDCLRATDYRRFLELLAEGLLAAFESPGELALIQRWSQNQPLILQKLPNGKTRLVWQFTSGKEWVLFQALLTLPQVLAEWLDCRVVLVFQNFPHLRSWDRHRKWEQYLRQEIQQQSRVSYALIATVAEHWVEPSDLQMVSLGPLADKDLAPWLETAIAPENLKFEPDALLLFLSHVQGHFRDTIALLQRVWLDIETGGSDWQTKLTPHASPLLIQPHHVHRSTLALVEDLSVTFESLILLLPHSQVRVLESLALDPTDSPHAREYIQKHHLSRGGGLQGALASLEQKGLVYGTEYRYRIALPLLAFWLKYRLS
jgi:hypothetical protein